MKYTVRKTRSNNWALCYWGKQVYRYASYNLPPFELQQWMPVFVHKDFLEVMKVAIGLGVEHLITEVVAHPGFANVENYAAMMAAYQEAVDRRAQEEFYARKRLYVYENA